MSFVKQGKDLPHHPEEHNNTTTPAEDDLPEEIPHVLAAEDVLRVWLTWHQHGRYRVRVKVKFRVRIRVRVSPT